MSDLRFMVKRADGRSDSQVIIDLTADAEPGRIFKFDELKAALSANNEHEYTIHAIRSVVSRTERRMLRERSRVLVNVRGIGYKLAHASEHQMVAKVRKDRADTLLKKGLSVLRNVRWDEMDANQRSAHEGTLMLLSAVANAQAMLMSRQDNIENLLKGIIARK